MADQKSLKEDWLEVGKGVGKSVVGVGKSILKSAKVGTEKIEDWADGKKDEPRAPKETGLLESWSEVGHTIGHTAAGLGKAIADTVKAGSEKIEEQHTREEAEKSKGNKEE